MESPSWPTGARLGHVTTDKLGRRGGRGGRTVRVASSLLLPVLLFLLLGQSSLPLGNAAVAKPALLFLRGHHNAHTHPAKKEVSC